ncbi:DUF952 domain-containing protein [Nocardioides sp. zg-ZUI104]|uniref:DUF952 domain-containing protein n=1 Tax=Nocardioides faecalis TaxID=2803858 RepID=UPI001BCFBE09|nr:DUF952 domain-containing protein [Nocardioides faecalis]MBS4752399.1 DUF952 domain-containing protein [Nocardioides faecalis]
MSVIFHLALASDWARAQRDGVYTTSTLGRTLAEEGFIHASRADQWAEVRDRYYAGVTEPLVLLQIDTDRLDVPVVEEPAVPGGTETFPHIYGRLQVSAVVRAISLAPATPTPPNPPTPPAPAPPAVTSPAARRTTAPEAGFSRLFLEEMFINAGLVLLVVALGSLGIAVGLGVGLALDTEAAPGIGGVIGVVAGTVLAVRLYRQRRRSTRP